MSPLRAAFRLLPLALAACASTPEPARTPYLLVLEKQDGALIEVEPATRTVIERFPTARGPHEVAASRDGRFAVVAEYGDQTPGSTLAVYDLVTRRRVRGIDLAPHQRPHGIALIDDDTLLVTSETSQAVLEVDWQRGAVVRVLPTEAKGSHMLAVSPDGARVYTANIGSGTVSAIDLASGKLIEQAGAGDRPEAIAITPDGAELWIGLNGENAVVVLDAATLATRGRIEDLALPIRVQCAPRGDLVVVSCAASGEVALVDRASRRVVARVELEKASGGQAPPGFAPGTPVPVGIVIEPSGERAYVALTAADRVAIVDLVAREVTGHVATGAGPDGVAWTLR